MIDCDEEGWDLGALPLVKDDCLFSGALAPAPSLAFICCRACSSNHVVTHARPIADAQRRPCLHAVATGTASPHSLPHHARAPSQQTSSNPWPATSTNNSKRVSPTTPDTPVSGCKRAMHALRMEDAEQEAAYDTGDKRVRLAGMSTHSAAAVRVAEHVAQTLPCPTGRTAASTRAATSPVARLASPLLSRARIVTASTSCRGRTATSSAKYCPSRRTVEVPLLMSTSTFLC